MSRIQSLPRAALLSILSLAALIASTSDARAQGPKAGREYYEDNVDLGFKVKMPKDWEFIPPQPGDDQLIGKFTPQFNKYLDLDKGNDQLWIDAFLVKFDRRDEKDESDYDFDAALDKYADRLFSGVSGLERIETKDLKIDKVPTKEILYLAKTRGGSEVHVYAMQYFFSEDLVVSYLFDAPSDKKKWRKWQSDIKNLCKSMRRVDLKEVKGGGGKEGDSVYRSSKRGALLREVKTQPGWQLIETENYFIITSCEDRDFLRDVEMRLEAIRNIYEKLYPLKDAERVRIKMADRIAEAQKQKKREREDEKDDDDPSKGRTSASGPTPLELSRCSVVRVCKSQGQYSEYGGPFGSAGYWNYRDEELVIYDDKAGGGRSDSWATLNHEAFHQYIFYFYGSLAPHSWYNEGTGDFFAGYQLKAGRFTLKPFDWRVQTIREAIKNESYVPMQDFFRFTQQDYYGEKRGQNYAQGWSLIYFLRTGKKSAKGWNSDWDSLLDDYLEALNNAWIDVKVENILKDDVEIGEDGSISFDFSNSSEEDARSKAVEAAVVGIDWDEFEAAWKAYTL
jgi:hypothetical protein